jgi:hypothetical protein
VYPYIIANIADYDNVFFFNSGESSDQFYGTRSTRENRYRQTIL